MKRIFGLLTVVLLCLGVMLCITACAEDTEGGDSKYADYKITVVDGLGTPLANVMATFTDAEGTTKKTVTAKDGTAKFKNVAIGENTVLLEKGFSDADIMQESYKFAAGSTEMQIVLRNEKNTIDIYGEIGEDCYAYVVGDGTHNLFADEGKISYVVFNAVNSGVYKVSFTSDDADMTVAYYGVPLFVQSTHRGDGAYDGKTFELIIQDPETPYVIGLDCKSTATASLTIERIGDAPFDPQYSPWTPVNTTEDFKQYTTCVLDKLTIENETSIVEYKITPVNLTTPGIGYDGTYIATAADGSNLNIAVNGDSITVGNESYKFEIKNGVPRILDGNNEPLEAMQLGVAGNITDLDISDASLSVTLGSDGYYYTSDGKLVYLHISTASRYYEAPLALLAGFMDQNVGGTIGGYVYDENGNYVNKLSYNDMIGKYYDFVDANGVYPLTEEMVDAIKLHAQSIGWWDSESANFVLGEVDYIAENAWLFLCCTAE